MATPPRAKLRAAAGLPVGTCRCTRQNVGPRQLGRRAKSGQHAQEGPSLGGAAGVYAASAPSMQELAPPVHAPLARTHRTPLTPMARAGAVAPGTSIELRSHVLDAVPLDPNVDPLRLVGLDALLGPELVVIEREGRLVPIEALPLEAAAASYRSDFGHQIHHARAKAAHAGLGLHVQVL
eukprot:CAMPEP_0198611572 /NCGR_PEP_ID=MMETSP1462-20131121/157460_1 /TAXON_ID=1333877 /ORGANISM="Brandtodinium nutriculum, Strain RCC3387" /LENGTH=179 /DNA_ID=CAMNT_0044343377 /DNA_START=752 /DNA_END=1293 /DNA_ORIENTATION=-